MTISWQPTTLVQCVSTRPWLVYPGCDEPGGCHDLTLGKIYEMLGVEGNGSFYRIIDDSGEDFLYPVSHFKCRSELTAIESSYAARSTISTRDLAVANRSVCATLGRGRSAARPAAPGFTTHRSVRVRRSAACACARTR